MSSNSKSQTHMLVLSNVYSMNKQICFSPIEPTWTPSFVIRGTPPPRFPITLKCCLFIVLIYWKTWWKEDFGAGGDEPSLHFHFFFSYYNFLLYFSLTPLESSMPGSILKALVGNGNKADPRAFWNKNLFAPARIWWFWWGWWWGPGWLACKVS